MSVCQTPIIVALDYPTRDAALKLADQLDPKLCRVKVGKELFTSCAAEIVGTLRDKGFEVFLDLKFHDIPNTTAMAVKAAAEMGVWMVNVHCSGGLRMMTACREVLEQRSGPKPLLIGVTVLTSMEREDLAGIGLDIEPQEQVLRYAGTARIELSDSREALVIRVIDHGPGIAEDKREAVFEPFFRLEGSRNRNSGGVGLGMTIAKDAVERLGGRLNLEETPGGGLTAVMWLPRA